MAINNRTKFALALSAAVAAFDAHMLPYIGAGHGVNQKTLQDSFNWETVQYHIDIANIAMAVYTKEIADTFGYFRTGLTAGSTPLSEGAVLRSFELQKRSFRKALELAQQDGLITEASIVNVFDPDTDDTNRFTIFLKTRESIGFLPFLVTTMRTAMTSDDTATSAATINIKTMTDIILCGMLFNSKDA